MPLLAELLNSFDSLYMTDPFLYLLVMQTPFTLSNNKLIAFLKIRASMCKLFAATLFKFNDSFLPLVSD